MFESFYDGPKEPAPLIKMALEQRCEAEGNWALNNAERAFYTFKLIVCILLRRVAKADIPGGTGFRMCYFGDDPVTVAAWNGQEWYSPDGTEYSFDQIVVGYGLFTEWRYRVEENM